MRVQSVEVQQQYEAEFPARTYGALRRHAASRLTVIRITACHQQLFTAPHNVHTQTDCTLLPAFYHLSNAHSAQFIKSYLHQLSHSTLVLERNQQMVRNMYVHM